MSTTQHGPRPGFAGGYESKVDVKTLQNDLQKAITKAFNPHPTIYRRATVQFMKFKDGDLDVDGPERELARVFRNEYNFTTRFYEIGSRPNLNPTQEVQALLVDLQSQFGGENCLLIIVFSGHGEVDAFHGKRTLWLG
jgi:hypothetical protein